jgi:hypothetical protein
MKRELLKIGATLMLIIGLAVGTYNVFAAEPGCPCTIVGNCVAMLHGEIQSYGTITCTGLLSCTGGNGWITCDGHTSFCALPWPT